MSHHQGSHERSCNGRGWLHLWAISHPGVDRQREGYQPNDQYTTQDQATDSQQEPEDADSELSRQWQRMMCSEPRTRPKCTICWTSVPQTISVVIYCDICIEINLNLCKICYLTLITLWKMKVKFVILSFVKFEFGKMSEICYSSFYD